MALEAYAQASWNVDEFVQVVNRLLPDYMPESAASQRVREEVNVRLVRHYTSLGTLDEPGKEGKEARYRFRHLLQLLLVRRMLGQGYGSSAIVDFARKQSDSQLLQLLTGQLQLTVGSNEALDYLDSLRQRRGTPAPRAATPPSASASHWQRVILSPSLELHVREDFACPPAPTLESLVDTVRDTLRAKKGGRSC